jgi:uncharacterized protein (TIGR03382 family)
MKWLALSLTLIVAGTAPAYVRTTTKSSNPPCPGDTARPLYWNVVTVPFVIDAAGSPDAPGEASFDAVRASFQTWQSPPCTYLRFRDDGKKTDAPVGYNSSGQNLNVIKWLETTWDYSSQAIAVTLTTFDCNSGQIYDADLVLNGKNFTFTTNPAAEPRRIDIQNTVTHEVGHFIGFDHSPDPESTMYADAPAGETRKRTLTDDDILGVCTVYALGKEPGKGGCAAAGDGTAGLAATLALTTVFLVRRRGRRPGQKPATAEIVTVETSSAQASRGR